MISDQSCSPKYIYIYIYIAVSFLYPPLSSNDVLQSSRVGVRVGVAVAMGTACRTCFPLREVGGWRVGSLCIAFRCRRAFRVANFAFNRWCAGKENI